MVLHPYFRWNWRLDLHNPVLDANGSIIAVDVVSMGRGYSKGGTVT